MSMRRGLASTNGDAQALRSEMHALRESTERSVQGINAAVSTQLQTMSSSVQTGLAAVNTNVADRLDAINKHVSDRLGENTSTLTQTTRQVNDRVASVQVAFTELQKQVSAMTEQARQIADVSKSLGELERIFSAPKLRGGFGELQLETLLAQVFAADQYQTQVRMNS